MSGHVLISVSQIQIDIDSVGIPAITRTVLNLVEGGAGLRPSYQLWAVEISFYVAAISGVLCSGKKGTKNSENIGNIEHHIRCNHG